MRYKIIVNPTSGRGTGEQSIPQIENILKNAGLDFDLVRTKKPWHAVALAQEAASQGYDVVVSAGGDGTANEVINGLMQAKKAGQGTPAMGVLTVGRGNDFGYSMGIPTELEAGCQTLIEDQRRTFDVGLVTGGLYPDGRYFGNGVGIGFDAAEFNHGAIAQSGFDLVVDAVLLDGASAVGHEDRAVSRQAGGNFGDHAIAENDFRGVFVGEVVHEGSLSFVKGEGYHGGMAEPSKRVTAFSILSFPFFGCGCSSI